MLSAIARRIVTYNKVKWALLSYEDVVDKLFKITDHCNLVRDPSDPIIHFYKVFIQHYFNNIGDPLTSSQLHLHSKEFEEEVIKYFSALYGLEEGQIGGYIEWDYQRSELFIMNVVVNRFKSPPIFFLRCGANRRIISQMKLFGVRTENIKFIASDPQHEGMDLKHLQTEVEALNNNTPIVLWLSLGDMNGTVDNLNGIKSALGSRENVHIHYSCSNLGIMMPFLDEDFGISFKNGLDSISFPLSDFFGVPLNGGLAITKRHLSNMCTLEIAVVNEKDSTVPGSRMGHLQLLLWVALQARGTKGLLEEVLRTQKNCKYLQATLGPCVKADTFYSCIFFETHSRTLIQTWNLKKKSGSKNTYKLELLPHFTKAKLDRFMEEFKGTRQKLKDELKDTLPDEFPKMYLLSELDHLRLENFSRFLTDFKRTFVGYPINIEFSDKHLKNILKIFEYDITLSSVEGIQKDLCQYMAGILRIPLNEMHAVITSGGSFSNLLGSLIPQTYMDDGNPVIYVSHDAHYSVFKYAKILNMDMVVVKSQDSGELDYENLEEQILLHHPRPVIMFLNIGSTMKGAIDSIKKTKAIFTKLNLTQYHIHCDAALDGGFLPLIGSTPQHGFDMGIDSLAISLHKYLGVPIPCSIFITRKNLLTPDSINIIEDIFSVKDGVIMALIWYAINRQRTIPPGTEAKQQLEKADYLFQRLKSISYPAWRNQHSNIVYFKKPSPEIISKWKLATVEDLSHIVLMQHVDHDIINEFFEEICRDFN